MADKEFIVYGELPARVHQTVRAPNAQVARRRAVAQKAWFYDEQNDAPVKIVHVEEAS